jgi:hypothetical protein
MSSSILMAPMKRCFLAAGYQQTRKGRNQPVYLTRTRFGWRPTAGRGALSKNGGHEFGVVYEMRWYGRGCGSPLSKCTDERSTVDVDLPERCWHVCFDVVLTKDPQSAGIFGLSISVGHL